MIDSIIISFFDCFGRDPFGSGEGGFDLNAEMEHRRLTTEGGILNGVPVLKDTFNLFLVQATIIIGLCAALSWFGRIMKQPKVIFEIVAGIILGPSAIGQNVTYLGKYFPTSSLNSIYIVANLGLVLYLFLIGIEMDFKLLKTHASRCGGISFCGICLPFMLGLAVSRKMFDVLQASDPKLGGVSHVSFMVFIGTAMSITAFPVLARLLKEGGLIYTKPGSMVMAAAALDDATAWCLLALSIAIADGNSKGVGGKVFACVFAYAVGMVTIVRPIIAKVVKFYEDQNNQFFDSNLFSFTICTLFMSAWTTALLGVHAIFGAFVFGICIPRDSRLIHNCVHHIEQLILTITMPLYFCLSGLKTDITQIRGSQEWGMCCLICFLASAGKIVGCGSAALASGMSIRESSVVAVLMNTRGLVELIVLNVGLSAKILNIRTFSVMVIMCLFTTFITAPIVELIYPKSMRTVAVKIIGDGKEENIPEDTLPVGTESKEGLVNYLDGKSEFRMGIVLSSLSHFQHVMDLLACIVPVSSAPSALDRSVSVTAMRFVKQTNTERDNFIGLNEEGRLIKVDEESPEVVAVDHNKPNQSPILSLGVFCRVMGTAVNLLRIEGNPDEYPTELGRIADNSEVSFLLFNGGARDLFFQKLFWSTVHNSGNLIGLLVPQRGVSAAANSINAPSASSKFNPASLLSDAVRRMTIDEANASVNQASASATVPRTPITKRISSIACVLSNAVTDKFVFRLLELYILNGIAVTVVLPADWEAAESQELVHATRAFTVAFGSNGHTHVKVIVAAGMNHDNYAGLVSTLTGTAFDLLIVGYVAPTIVNTNPHHDSQAPPTTSSRRMRSASVSSRMLEMIEINTHDATEHETVETSHDPELGVLACIARDYPFVADADMLVLHAGKSMGKIRRASMLTTGDSTA